MPCKQPATSSTLVLSTQGRGADGKEGVGRGASVPGLCSGSGSVSKTDQRGSIPRRPATTMEGAAEWPATGPEHPGGGAQPQRFDSSALLDSDGAYDVRRCHRLFNPV